MKSGAIICILIFIIIIFMYVFSHVSVYIYATYGVQKWVSDILELKLQVVVCCLMWVLRIKLRCSERAESSPNH